MLSGGVTNADQPWFHFAHFHGSVTTWHGNNWTYLLKLGGEPQTCGCCSGLSRRRWPIPSPSARIRSHSWSRNERGLKNYFAWCTRCLRKRNRCPKWSSLGPRRRCRSIFAGALPQIRPDPFWKLDWKRFTLELKVRPAVVSSFYSDASLDWKAFSMR